MDESQPKVQLLLPAPPAHAALPPAPSSRRPPILLPGAIARRRLPWFRLSVVAVALLMFLCGVGILLAASLSQMKPSWWKDIDPQDKSVREAALRVENGAATQLTKIRKADISSSSGISGASDPWTIRLTSADANAWLAARLRPWLESQQDQQGGSAAPFKWPSELKHIEVEFDSGRIHIGASVLSAPRKTAAAPGAPAVPAAQAAPARPHFVAASLEPQFRDGSLWLPARNISVGRLSVPASWMLPNQKAGDLAGAAPGAPDSRSAAARALAPDVPEALAKMPQLKDVLSALSGGRPVMQSPVIKIGDGRRVRILSMDARDGALYITCQTLARETTRAEK